MNKIDMHKRILYDQILNIRYCYLNGNGLKIGIYDHINYAVRDWLIFQWESEQMLIEYDILIKDLI